ncbi:GatB/YqeY domain-containing protein, partial [Sutterella wadsworthensis]|uniref:GatB/YqeY domain-containing protein n=1 Tax=Sutterella wadsworthensis TaxID=40545 RepID=UPI0032C18E17
MKEQLMKELKQAMKEKDVLKKGLLQLLIAGIKNEEIKEKRELTKDEQLTVIKRELKQTKDSLEQAVNADRKDIAEEQRKKIKI